MKLDVAINILELHNRYRRGQELAIHNEDHEIEEAIDVVIDALICGECGYITDKTEICSVCSCKDEELGDFLIHVNLN